MLFLDIIFYVCVASCCASRFLHNNSLGFSITRTFHTTFQGALLHFHAVVCKYKISGIEVLVGTVVEYLNLLGAPKPTTHWITLVIGKCTGSLPIDR